MPPGSAFGLANLPYGVFSVDGENDGARVGVRIGDSVLDLARALGDEVFGEPSLNAFMAQGRTRWTEVRARITELLTAGQQEERHRGAAEAALRPLSAVRLHLPFAPGDYVDFFGNEYHAANAGRIFRPDGEPQTRLRRVCLAPIGTAYGLDMTTNDTLRVTDSRTGRSYELPIVDGAIRAIDLRQIKTSDDDFGLLSYDPAFQNTASCRSAITFIDGDKGILRYRGYPIEELASRASFLDVAWLLLRGEMPDKDESAGWAHQISHHTYVHENVKKFIDGFHHDAHPMGILVSTLAALSTFYPEASAVHDRANQDEQVVRLIAKMPTLAAFAYRHARGLPYAYPDDDLSYAGNFLNMMARMTEPKYEPNPILEHALDVLFILHADHEQNCSTNAMRSVSSSQVDPYSAAAAAAAALYGPLHGGANEQVLKMLREIGSVENVPAYINRVKSGELRLMGFGHRVYKNYDPRATIIKGVADQVFEVTGRNPLLDIALELERIALEDEYFISHKLYPNVDFYSGIIYQAMGFPVAMFPVLFAIGRMPGWLAHWQEGSTDKEQKIARPRQIYVGETIRHLNGGEGEGEEGA